MDDFSTAQESELDPDLIEDTPEQLGQPVMWEALEHSQERTHSLWWFVIVISVGVISAGVSWYFDNILFSIILLLATGIIVYVAKQPLQSHKVVVDDAGVGIDGRLHRYEELQAFWIGLDDIGPYLRLQTKEVFGNIIDLRLIDDIDIDDLYFLLSSNCSEKVIKNGAIRNMVDRLGF